MEAISRAVESGKDRGLTDEEIEAAVGEGMIRHERRRSGMAASGTHAECRPMAPSLWSAGPAVDPAPRIYCDPEIGQ